MHRICDGLVLAKVTIVEYYRRSMQEAEEGSSRMECGCWRLALIGGAGDGRGRKAVELEVDNGWPALRVTRCRWCAAGVRCGVCYSWSCEDRAKAVDRLDRVGRPLTQGCQAQARTLLAGDSGECVDVNSRRT